MVVPSTTVPLISNYISPMDGDKLTCAPGSRSDASKGKQEDSLESHFDEQKIVLSLLFLVFVSGQTT